MNSDIDKLLNPRIKKHCIPLFEDGHFPAAAREAMVQVELALKEKGQQQNAFGQVLIDKLFTIGGKNKNIKLIVPLGNELQEQAKLLFKGAFAYYRNYVSHDGRNINEVIALRILIIASDLLDLIGACTLSFEDIGGVEGLIKESIFYNKEAVYQFLSFLDGYTTTDEIFDGLFEKMFDKGGFTEQHLHAVIDLGLVTLHSEEYIPWIEEDWSKSRPPDSIERFELTELGKQILEASQAK